MTFIKRVISITIALMLLGLGLCVCEAAPTISAYTKHRFASVYDYYSGADNPKKSQYGQSFLAFWGKQHIRIPSVDFSEGAGSVVIAVAVDSTNAGKVEVRLDSAEGELLTTVQLNASNDWSVTVDTVGKITKKVSGIHDVYIVVLNGTSNMHTIQFYPKLEKVFNFDYSGATTYTDTYQTEYRDDIALASQLGLYKIFEESTLDIYEPVKRGEFAYALCNLINNTDLSEEAVDEKTASYTDIISHKYGAYIDRLCKLGVIVPKDKEFKPDEYMKVSDAEEIVYNLMKYDLLPQKAAKTEKREAKTKMFSGLNDAYVFNRGTLAKFIHNILDLNCVVYSHTENTSSYHKISTKGILYEMRGISRNFGQVTANCYTDLYTPASDILSGHIKIDGVKYETGENVFDSLIGYSVEYFYDNDGKLYGAIPRKNIEVEAISTVDSKITSITSSKIRYEKNEKTKDIAIKNTDILIYNNKAVDFDFSTQISASNFKGTITVIKSSTKKIIKIDEYVNTVLDSKTRQRITDGLNSNKYGLTGNIKYELFDNNDACLLSDIGINEIVLVYESKNVTGEKLIRFVKSHRDLTGYVTEISNEDIFIDSDETAYKAASELAKPVYAGMYAKFSINAFNEITDFTELMEEAVAVGFMTQYVKKNVNFSSGGYAEIHTKDNKTEVFEWSDKITVDGVKCKTGSEYEAALAFLGNPKDKVNTVVRYRLNDEGKLVLIDTYKRVAGGANDKLHRVTDNFISGQLRGGIICSGKRPRFPAKTGAYIFSIWATTGREEYITYDSDINWLPGGDKFASLQIYNFDETSEMADVVVWNGRKSLANADDFTDYMVFESIGKIVNNEGEVANSLIGYVKGVKTTLTVSNEARVQVPNIDKLLSILNTGDLIGVYVDNGEVIKVTPFYYIDKSLTKTSADGTVFTQVIDSSGQGIYNTAYLNYNFFTVTVKGREDRFIKIEPDCGIGTYDYANASSAYVVRINTRGGHCVIENNLTSDAVGVDDKVLVFYQNGSAAGIYILEN